MHLPAEALAVVAEVGHLKADIERKYISIQFQHLKADRLNNTGSTRVLLPPPHLEALRSAERDLLELLEQLRPLRMPRGLHRRHQRLAPSRRNQRLP